MNLGKRHSTLRHRQAGVVLLIAMIMLVVMTLVGISLFRQVDMGVVIARNLTFKQSATVASDRGIEVARDWIVRVAPAAGISLDQPSSANGYFPAWCNTLLDSSNRPDANNDGITDDCGASPPPPDFDPLTYNWTNSVLATADDGAGNEVRYVIHRLCRVPGAINVANQQCVTIGSAGSGGRKDAPVYGTAGLSNTTQPYYRITTRTAGPSNTIVFSQAVIY